MDANTSPKPDPSAPSAPENPWAFPRSGSEYIEPHLGMSLRDYFAAKAMQALLNKYGFDMPFPSKGEASPMPGLSQFAYEAADAMLQRREVK